MLELENIHYHPATAEAPVLEGVNLTAKKGDPTIISGPSGSGKTSLIEVISGLSRPQKGEILWNKDRAGERARRSISGVVFQFPERHFIGLTILQELKIGHRRLNIDVQNQALSKVGLVNINLKQPPECLSGGQQRRLAIAVQLLRNPMILLLDEPTAGLDWSVRDEILELIKQLSSEKILIVVTHEPTIFANWSVSSYQLQRGKLEQTSKLPSISKRI